MDAMHAAATSTGTPGVSYAMGWYVGETTGVPAIYHSGDNANYAAFLLMAPEDEIGIALLVNVNGFPVNNAAKQLSSGVLAILLDQAPRPYEKPEEVFLAVGSALLPCLVALLWTGWSIFRFIRRGKRAIAPRRSFMWWAFVIILPVLLNLVLLAVLLKGIPGVWELPLSGFAQMFPDYFTLIMLSSIALLVWGILGTVLTFKQSRA
jgi:hypothetical protein